MSKNLEIGSVLKTNPSSGYWVCSLALSARPKSTNFVAMSHVAVTNIVFEHDFEFSDIDLESMKILYQDKSKPCIGIYASKLVKDVEVIGKINPEDYFGISLSFEIGNGVDGGWPLCGPLKKSLGFEAVHKWRSVHDKDSWLNDLKEAEKSHIEMIERLKHESKAT